MAQAVEQALAEKRHLIVEAGTGTGKTLAYLVPVAAQRQARHHFHGDQGLQEQLFFKDVPFLEAALFPPAITAARLLHEGTQRITCAARKSMTLADQPILSGLEEIEQYRAIADWEKTTETGDRAEIGRAAGGQPRCGTSWTRGPKPASGRNAAISTAASSPRCGGGPPRATSSSSTIICSLPTWRSSAGPKMRPMPACCPMPLPSSSTRRMNWKTWPPATSASPSATCAWKIWRVTSRPWYGRRSGGPQAGHRLRHLARTRSAVLFAAAARPGTL